MSGRGRGFGHRNDRRGATRGHGAVRRALVLVPSSCRISAVGDTLTLNGDPNIVFESKARHIGLLGGIEFEFTAAGAVTWEKDGDSRNCKIEMALEDADVDPNEGTVRGHMKGVLCGREMVIDYTELV